MPGIGIGIGITAGVGRASGPQWAIDYDASRSAGPLLQLPAGTTFTRASAALAIDHNGVPWIAKSGEIVEWGKRRVENVLLSTGDISAGSWSGVNAGLASEGKVTNNSGSTNWARARQNLSLSAGPTVFLSAVFEPGNTDYAAIVVDDGSNYAAWCNASTGEVLGNDNGVTVGVQSLPNGSKRLWVKRTLTTGGTVGFNVGPAGSTGTQSAAGEFVYVTAPQLELAAPGQTEPSEYVSNGVLSAPYHGWGVDGVKYFNTDESGDPIPAETMRGIIVAPQATNVIRSASDLTRSPWHIEGAADSSLSFDPVMGGQYTQLRDVGAKFVDDVWLATGGLSGSTRYEPCFVIRAISSSGTLQLIDTQSGATGQWSIDLSAVGAGDLINRDHPAVTIDNEFVSVVSGNMGLTFAAAAGSLDFDVSLITLIEGTTPAPTPIPNASTSAAATRNADSLVVNVPDGSYSISTTYGDGSTEAVSDTASSGLTLTSADFSEPTVKKMQGDAA